MSNKIPMTPYGYRLLRNELLKLKGQRVEIAEAIEVARGHGDLSENGDYDAAKDRSGMVEAKIRDLESKLSMAEVIDPLRLDETPTRVVFGSTVFLEEVDSGEERKFIIVGTEESDVPNGLISFDSPIAKALIGKEQGETARVTAPGGAKEYEIREILVTYSPPAIEDFEPLDEREATDASR
jgi:transcription elongation factor GreA